MDFSLFGLTIRDKRVYEELLLRPQVSVRKIADSTNINRGSVFESIKSLLAAGLVTQTLHGKRIMYRAKDPEVLREILIEKQAELRNASTQVDSYIAKLGKEAATTEQFHFASFYDGDEGLATILRDVLKTCRRTGVRQYLVVSSPRVSKYLYNNFPHFTRERIRQGLSVRILRQGSIAGEQAELAETRFFAGGAHDTGCYTIIYGGKVSVLTIDSQNQTSGITIDNAEYADMQEQLFEASWDAKTS